MPRSREELLKIIADLVNDVVGVPVEDVTPDKSLVDDLDIDSLAMVEIMVGLEQEAGVTVPDGEAKNLKTVGDVLTYLQEHSA